MLPFSVNHSAALGNRGSQLHFLVKQTGWGPSGLWEYPVDPWPSTDCSLAARSSWHPGGPDADTCVCSAPCCYALLGPFLTLFGSVCSCGDEAASYCRP